MRIVSNKNSSLPPEEFIRVPRGGKVNFVETVGKLAFGAGNLNLLGKQPPK